MLIYLNGKFVEKEEAKVSVFDHGLLYGDGVFEGIRSYDGCIFKLDEHLERLYNSAKYIVLTIPLECDEMKKAVIETVKVNKLRNAYIRLLITRGEGSLGLAPWACDTPSVIIIADTIELYPKEYYEKGLKVITASTRRTNVDALNARVKSMNYLNNILAKIEAKIAGVLEAFMLNSEGYIVECTGDNVFIVKDNTLYTPPVYQGALKGITRDCVMEIAEKLGYRVVEQPFTRFEVYIADECFLTGTAAEIIPVVQADDRQIGDGKPGKTTKKLITEFHKVTKTDGTMIC